MSKKKDKDGYLKEFLLKEGWEVALEARKVMADAKVKKQKEETRKLAKTLYKEIFSEIPVSCLTGESRFFDRFIKLAEKIQRGDLTSGK